MPVNTYPHYLIVMDKNSTGQQYGKQLPSMADLLGAPLVAAATANSFMVREQTRFLMDTCFVSKGDNLFEPVMIELSLTKNIISENDKHEVASQEVVVTFKIPLLTLVPLSSLVVDNVDIDFSLEIVSYTGNNGNGATEEQEDSANKEGWSKKKEGQEPVLTGKLSYDANDKSQNRSHNASKLNVKIHAGTIPLPTGVTTLIDLYVKSINAVPKQTKE